MNSAHNGERKNGRKKPDPREKKKAKRVLERNFKFLPPSFIDAMNLTFSRQACLIIGLDFPKHTRIQQLGIQHVARKATQAQQPVRWCTSFFGSLELRTPPVPTFPSTVSLVSCFNKLCCCCRIWSFRCFASCWANLSDIGCPTGRGWWWVCWSFVSVWAWSWACWAKLAVIALVPPWFVVILVDRKMPCRGLCRSGRDKDFARRILWDRVVAFGAWSPLLL